MSIDRPWDDDVKPTTPTPFWSRPKNVIGASVLTLVVVAGISAVIWPSTGGAAGQSGAVNACHQAVESELLSPSSADFSDESVSRSGDTFTISGTVDSDNAFGASLRSSYTCTSLMIVESETYQTTASVF